MTSGGAAWLLFFVFILTPSISAESAPPGGSIPVRSWEIHGQGVRRHSHKDDRLTQRRQLDVLRTDDNTIRGRVFVSDSLLIEVADLEGHIMGSRVTGRIVDDEDNRLADFTGTITPKGIRGSYKDRTGEVGSRKREGPLPK